MWESIYVGGFSIGVRNTDMGDRKRRTSVRLSVPASTDFTRSSNGLVHFGWTILHGRVGFILLINIIYSWLFSLNLKLIGACLLLSLQHYWSGIDCSWTIPGGLGEKWREQVWQGKGWNSLNACRWRILSVSVITRFLFQIVQDHEGFLFLLSFILNKTTHDQMHVKLSVVWIHVMTDCSSIAPYISVV